MKKIITHKCESRKLNEEMKIIYGPSIDKDWDGWIFQLKSIADEKDVQMGEASHVGEITFQSQFSIKFCPYCGIELK